MHGVAVLVHEFVQRAEIAVLVAPDHAREGLLPLAILVIAAFQEIRVRERRLIRAILDVVDDAERLEIDAEIAVEALIHRDDVAAWKTRCESAIGLAHCIAVLPGFDHLGAGRVAPGFEDLREPALDIHGGDADRAGGGLDAGVISRLRRGGEL